MFRQEVELSDDDAEIAIEKVVDKSINSKTSEIERLIELREQIRVSRLHPDAVRSVLSLMAVFCIDSNENNRFLQFSTGSRIRKKQN